MKRANSSTVRTALHEMRMFAMIQGAASLGAGMQSDLYMARIEAIQKAVDDDDFLDPRVVRQNADGKWEDIPDAP